MRQLLALLCVLLYVCLGECNLWPKGVVHYTINSKDYDLHSQDVIRGVFEAVEREVCVKFFHATNNTAANSDTRRILYISNPDKMKTCPPLVFNYTGTIVDMPIGYKCINEKEVSRIVVDMLRASIDQSDPISSYDMLKQYRQRNHDGSTLLSPDDRNFINTHYLAECGSLQARPGVLASRRASAGDALDAQIAAFYDKLLWPLGVVMYGVAPDLRGSPLHSILKFAMTTIELSSCVVFQFHDEHVIEPRNILYFDKRGDEMPHLGFKQGNQSIDLRSMVAGAAGHTAHALNNLMRALGVPMMSNRYDRDNYLNINWKNVEKGKEFLLEKMPEDAWLTSVPYDFNSVTHAPANYACSACRMGRATVEPLQDHLWQRTLSMGHRTALSEGDIRTLNIIYRLQCQARLQ